MQPHNSHPQNEFLNALRKERKRLEVYLVNGIRLTGIIESFDQFLVTLRTPGGMQGIYKQAISTIQLDTGHRPAPRPGREDGSRYERAPRAPREASSADAPVVVTRKRRALPGQPVVGADTASADTVAAPERD